ncbi:MAG: FtsX-like permease family protein [bacterium]|nr:FtsX-like permease family protein [bacterium]
MKLAWKELKHDKARYVMVEAILVLMVFMVLFLSGLANGLGRAVSAGIENADAKYFAVNDTAENLITISSLTPAQVDEVKKQATGNIATLDIQRMNLNTKGSDNKIDVTYFAIDPSGFLAPVITEGISLEEADVENGIVLDDSFKDEGIALNDEIMDSTTGIAMKVVGFTHDEYYGHSSIGFMSVETYTAIRKEINPAYELMYHAVALQQDNMESIHVDGVSISDKATIIKNIPGYSAEQTTINMIIWVLVVISAAILGVFFYIITIQKQKQYGVLKAIGMRMSEISTMIIGQVAILACVGMVIGNALVWGMSKVLPSGMPFYLEGKSAAVISAAFMVIAIVSSLVSTRKVAKVDPIVTIGGNE